MQKADGMNYAPKGKSKPVCQPGDFCNHTGEHVWDVTV